MSIHVYFVNLGIFIFIYLHVSTFVACSFLCYLLIVIKFIYQQVVRCCFGRQERKNADWTYAEVLRELREDAAEAERTWNAGGIRNQM